MDILRKAFVGQWFYVTTDTWTSIQNLNYMIVTAHFIDSDWTYQKKILNFSLIANYKGDTIGRMVESCLLKWDIDHLFTITIDNVSSNDVAIDYVKKKKKEKKKIIAYELMHMCCCAHILDLIVQSGLKSIHESFVKVRNAVQYMWASPARFEKSQECVDKEKIKAKCLLFLDVPRRWNSTYLMLDYALKFVRAFDKLEEEYRNYKLYFCEADGNGKKPLVLLAILIGKISRSLWKFLAYFMRRHLNFLGPCLSLSWAN